MRETRIRTYATVFMLVVALFTIIYAVLTVRGLLNFALFNPQWMLRHPWSGGVVTDATRWLWIATWLPTTIVGLYACGAALMLANLCRKGLYFAPTFATGLSHVGLALVGSMILDLLAHAVSPVVLSMNSPAGQHPMIWQFRSESLGLLLAGFGFFALGWVMRQAIAVAEENREFV